MSVSAVARRMGVHPANLTHHFKLLEKVGLIRLVEKRETGKNLEKFYRAVAYHFVVEPGFVTTRKSLLALSILRDNLTSALQAGKSQPDEQDVLALLKTVRLEPDDLERFAQKLLALADEFVELSSPTGAAVYSLNISLYPTQAGGNASEEIIIREDQ